MSKSTSRRHPKKRKHPLALEEGRVLAAARRMGLWVLMDGPVKNRLWTVFYAVNGKECGVYKPGEKAGKASHADHWFSEPDGVQALHRMVRDKSSRR